MRTSLSLLPLALALATAPAAAQTAGAPACRDSITGNAVMTAQAMLQAERESHPDSLERQGFRLVILTQRFEAWTREARRVPRDLGEFAPAVSEVPWLSTCDLWGRRITYSRDGREFFLRSAGPDGRLDTADDIRRSVSLAHGIPLPADSASATH